MTGRFVIDASVAAKFYFAEEGCDLAAAALRESDGLIAPDLLFVEMVSIAAKKVRRGLASKEEAARAVLSIGEILDETVPSRELAPRLFELAAAHGFSAYDAAYLALAELHVLQLLTADIHLARRAREAGFSDRLRLLGDGD